MREIKVKLSVDTDIDIPSIPNFLRSGKQVFPISSFSEAQLRIIGEAWIRQLIEKSKPPITN